MNPPKLASVALAVVLVSTAFVGAGAVGVAAQSDETADESDDARDEVHILDKDVEISDGLLTIEDTTIEGPGVGERHIEDRKYTVDSTLSFDGFHIDYDGTRYTICRVTVDIEDVGVHLKDVTLTEGGE